MVILVVVDMQASYSAAQDSALCRGVEKAAAQADHLIHLQYDNCGHPTVDLSEKCVSLWKDKNDGGNEVYCYLLGAGLIHREMVVHLCGVNMGACVFTTTIGLAQRLFDEHGITNACRIVVDLCGDENNLFRFVQTTKPTGAEQAAHKVLHNPKSSKKAKTARGSALTSRK